MTAIIDQFLASANKGVSNVVRSAAGALVGWRENGGFLSVTRNTAAGNVFLKLTIGQLTLTETYTYSLTTGAFTGTAGEHIPTLLADEIMSSGVDGAGAVRSITNPLAGKATALSAGSQLFGIGKNKITTQYSFKPAGTFAQSGSGDITRQMIFAAPNPITALRIRARNVFAAATGNKVSFGWSSGVSSLLVPTGGWNAVTWNGGSATYDTATPSSGTGITAVSNSVLSDLIAVPSVAVLDGVLAGGKKPGAIGFVRSYAPAAQLMPRYDLPNTLSFAESGLFSSFQTTVDGVTTPANFTSTTGSNTLPPFEFILYGQSDVRSFMHCGASTVSGVGDDTVGNCRGWAYRACNAITSVVAVNQNFGFSGQSTVNSFAEALVNVPALRPSVAAYGGFSTNDADVGTAAGDARCIAQLVQFVEMCRQNNVTPALVTFQAWNGATGAQQTSRANVNNAIYAICATGAAVLIDIYGAVSSGNGWANAAWTTDGLHPNSTGHQVIADYVRASLEMALAAS